MNTLTLPQEKERQKGTIRSLLHLSDYEQRGNNRGYRTNDDHIAGR